MDVLHILKAMLILLHLGFACKLMRSLRVTSELKSLHQEGECSQVFRHLVITTIDNDNLALHLLDLVLVCQQAVAYKTFAAIVEVVVV